jgi:hypothetical protein
VTEPTDAAAERVGARRDLVEDVAARVAARLRPGYSTEQRKSGAAGRAPVPWEERYEAIEVAAGTADDDTMVVFTAGDGMRSIRALTWREVAFEVLGEALPVLGPEDVPQVEARLREQFAAEIEAAEVAGLEPGPGGLGPAARWGLGLAARIVRGA